MRGMVRLLSQHPRRGTTPGRRIDSDEGLRRQTVKLHRIPFLALAIAALVLAACKAGGGTASPSASTAAASESAAASASVAIVPAPTSLIRAGQLVDCVDIEYPPLEYFATADVTDPNQAIGFDVDSAKAVAAKLGLTITIRNTGFGALIQDLKTGGRCDIVWSGLFISDERTAVADVVPYLKTGHVVMVTTGNPKGIHTVMDLCGKTISIQTSGLVETVSAQASKDCTAAGKSAIDIQGYAKVSDEFQQIVLGRVDAIWETEEAVVDWMTRNPDKYEVAFVASQDKTYGIYYQKGMADIGVAFSAALKALKDDGTLGGIAQKYDLDPSKLDAIK
jgi:ABC-type amino acid transport substrate-binding protein